MESKRERGLRRSSDFSIIKKQGRNINVTKWLVLNFKKNDLGFLRFGVTVSRKVGKAVIRNKWKRWCRVYVQNLIKGGYTKAVDINFVFRPSAGGILNSFSYNEFKEVLDGAFKKI